MKVNPKIFKAYDIRGLYPQDINEEAVCLIGQAFVKFLKKETSKPKVELQEIEKKLDEILKD